MAEYKRNLVSLYILKSQASRLAIGNWDYETFPLPLSIGLQEDNRAVCTVRDIVRTGSGYNAGVGRY